MTATQQASLIGFATIASADPGRIAVVEPDRSQWTYGELVCRVNQLSHAFAAMGLRPGHCVAAIVPTTAARTTSFVLPLVKRVCTSRRSAIT
ncbi:MAG: AMP-binding protein [Haloechinothrix sp.]